MELDWLELEPSQGNNDRVDAGVHWTLTTNRPNTSCGFIQFRTMITTTHFIPQTAESAILNQPNIIIDMIKHVYYLFSISMLEHDSVTSVNCSVLSLKINNT